MLEKRHVESTFVLPASKRGLPKPPAIIQLHGLDTALPVHTEIRHLFRIDQKSASIKDVIENLRNSLADALEIYYPVAGTVVDDDNGDRYIATDAENLLGALFIIERKEAAFEADSEELSPRTDVLLKPGSHIFAAKLSHFTCGTVVLAGSMHHQVADLGGYFDFVEIWARLSRGEKVVMTSTPDDWERKPMRFFSGLYTQPGVPAPPPGFSILDAARAGPPSFKPSIISVWKITKDALERLKQDFTSSDTLISSGDALAALFWGTITRARKEGGVPRRPTAEPDHDRLAMAADGRQRAPGRNMAGRYFGNFNVLITFLAPRTDLLLPTKEGGSRVALYVRKAITEQLTAERVAHRIAFYEAPKSPKPAGRVTLSADVIMTNWCKFDLASPKFNMGHGIGKPVRAIPANTIYPAGFVRLVQERTSGDIFALVTVEPPAVESFQSDTLLRMYATMV